LVSGVDKWTEGKKKRRDSGNGKADDMLGYSVTPLYCVYTLKCETRQS